MKMDWDFSRVVRIDVDFKKKQITGYQYKDSLYDGHTLYYPYQDHVDWTKKLVSEKVLPSLQAHMKITGEDLNDCMACILDNVIDSLYENE